VPEVGRWGPPGSNTIGSPEEIPDPDITGIVHPPGAWETTERMPQWQHARCVLGNANAEKYSRRWSERASAEDIVAAMGNKTIAILGDSVSENVFDGLACNIGQHLGFERAVMVEYKFSKEDVKACVSKGCYANGWGDDRCKVINLDEPPMYCQEGITSLHVPDIGLRMDHFKPYSFKGVCVGNAAIGSLLACLKAGRKWHHYDYENYMPLVLAADVIVWNQGLHFYTQEPESYKLEYQTWLGMFLSSKRLSFAYETSAQHFPDDPVGLYPVNPDDAAKFDHCVPTPNLTRPSQDFRAAHPKPMQQTEGEVLAEILRPDPACCVPFGRLPTEHFLRERHDIHKIEGSDCTHFALGFMFFEPLFTELVGALNCHRTCKCYSAQLPPDWPVHVNATGFAGNTTASTSVAKSESTADAGGEKAPRAEAEARTEGRAREELRAELELEYESQLATAKAQYESKLAAAKAQYENNLAAAKA
jgi:hypothetical protein